jgi:hypothetical protein
MSDFIIKKNKDILQLKYDIQYLNVLRSRNHTCFLNKLLAKSHTAVVLQSLGIHSVLMFFLKKANRFGFIFLFNLLYICI